MQDLPPPAPPAVITSTPAGVLRTGVAAFDDRFGGGVRGDLIVVASSDREHLLTVAAHGARGAVEAGCRVAWADFGAADAWTELARRVPSAGDAVQRLAQPVPVREVVSRVEWLRSDPSLELLVVDLAGIRSPAQHALRELKLLALRERILVLVAVVHEPRGTGLGAFEELPDHADVLLHVASHRPGAMFAPTYRLRVCKARPFEPLTLPVRWDLERGLVSVEASA